MIPSLFLQVPENLCLCYDVFFTHIFDDLMTVKVSFGTLKDRNSNLRMSLADPSSPARVSFSTFSTGRELAALLGLTKSFARRRRKGLDRGGVRPHGTGLFRVRGVRLPAAGSGRHRRPLITDDIREVVFQIGFPAAPAASGANSTGRITPVAARLGECGLYKHSANKKKGEKKLKGSLLSS